jgi:hypothetical protein
MIPDFDEHGYLRPGVHPATLGEIEERFARGSETRGAQFESIIWLIDAAAQCEVRRIVINGSYVTDVAEPNDVDCVLLIGDNFQMEGDAEQRLLAVFPFLNVQLVEDEEFSDMVDFFATDRRGIEKGIVEVIR